MTHGCKRERPQNLFAGREPGVRIAERLYIDVTLP